MLKNVNSVSVENYNLVSVRKVRNKKTKLRDSLEYTDMNIVHILHRNECGQIKTVI